MSRIDRRGSLVIAVVCLILAGGLLAFAAFGEVRLCPPNVCNGATVLNPPLAPHRGVLA